MFSKSKIWALIALASLLPLLGFTAAAQRIPEFDPGLATLATRLAGSMETVPLDDALRHFGVLGQEKIPRFGAHTLERRLPYPFRFANGTRG